MMMFQLGNRRLNRAVTMRVTLAVVWCGVLAQLAVCRAELTPVGLRCEYREEPLAVEDASPRLEWRFEPGAERGARQTAYRVLVASKPGLLEQGTGDLWDSGKVDAYETTGVAYKGKPLASRRECWWKVMAWDQDMKPGPWSRVASWRMGLLQPRDWKADWINYRDTSALHTSREQLYLPAPREYRKEFATRPKVKRAVLYATALGLYEVEINGKRVGDSYFTPGWSDYRRRAYYEAWDVTPLLVEGTNAVGATVSEGWYSGYVGYGLLVGYGPNKTGRYFYGKTPALLAQLEIETEDGSRQVVATDKSWKVSAEGPTREADMIMGEAYDARMATEGWSRAGFDDHAWGKAILAAENGSTKAVFSDTTGDREVELGFQRPAKMQAYPGPPIRVTEELKAVRMTEPKPGVYIFDLGQNFAGAIRLKLKGKAGQRIQLRYGEMLHTDGRLMTENLRRARATDFYTFRGAAEGEAWTPRFTYHGFQFVEVTGLEAKPELDAITGLAIHSDTPLASSFECSDPMANRLFRNIVWTQRANFVELPTDCPQRDERLGWMGDAQIYVRAASYNADVASFYTKWLDDLEEAQRSFGAYPDYAPYPMAHGEARKTFGTAWMDAGIICPWTIFHVYDDTRLVNRHYASMTRFMEFREATSPKNLGVSIGNSWGDWLSLGEDTPIEYVDAAYYAYSTKLMADMAEGSGRELDAKNYKNLFGEIRRAFAKEYVLPGGKLKVDTQTAYALALWVGLLEGDTARQAAEHLAAKVQKNEYRMSTGFLGTRPLLPVLSAGGQHDLAVRLFQSRRFPSWGYEVENGATTIWERWNSFTKDKGFGDNNAAMNSFSHYSFGAVCEWMFRYLAGIDTDGRGYRKLLLRPGPPHAGSNPEQKPIDWVKASYAGPTGRIEMNWRRLEAGRFEWETAIPVNTTATLYLPSKGREGVTEGGAELAKAAGVEAIGQEGDRTVLRLQSGRYRFVSAWE